MKPRWYDGNQVHLLENGDDFYPRVWAALKEAKTEIFIETFILADDKVGQALRTEAIDAAGRGVRVTITVDGFGSPGLEGDFINGLTQAGVNFHVFNPRRSIFGVRTNLFRRLHRKLVVIDEAIAFIGGINFCADQLSDFGPAAKRDYAVEIQGPVVSVMRDFAAQFVEKSRRRPRRKWFRPDATRPQKSSAAKDAQVLFVTRDNKFERTTIEHYYQLAFRTAQRELIIANAYFFPGYRLLRRLQQAARRGVKVSLILQGNPDIPIVKLAASLLYRDLLSAGVDIYEYAERPLHGKVAIADDEWATVGSSNLDPLSLSLNLEANSIIKSRKFNRELRARLRDLIENHCEQILPDQMPRDNWWRGIVTATVFHFLRHFPNWAQLLPAHTIQLKRGEDYIS